MPSPVPKWLRTEEEVLAVPAAFRDHVVDCDPAGRPLAACPHPAKYAPGVPTLIRRWAGTDDLGDPMAGSGRLAEETGLPVKLNEYDPHWRAALLALPSPKLVTFDDARQLTWSAAVMAFSPPYYPRTDRATPNAHDDAKRGRVVGFRDSYPAAGLPGFLGNPGGVNAIRAYRAGMLEVLQALRPRCERLILVTKNWTRLGVELRLDLDMILTAAEAGFTVYERHGYRPRPSLWARFNEKRGGGVPVEDVLCFA